MWKFTDCIGIFPLLLWALGTILSRWGGVGLQSDTPVYKRHCFIVKGVLKTFLIAPRSSSERSRGEIWSWVFNPRPLLFGPIDLFLTSCNKAMKRCQISCRKWRYFNLYLLSNLKIWWMRRIYYSLQYTGLARNEVYPF